MAQPASCCDDGGASAGSYLQLGKASVCVTVSSAWAPGSSFGSAAGGLSWSLVLLGAGNKQDDRRKPPLPRHTSQPPEQNEKDGGNLYLLPEASEIRADERLMARDAHSPRGP